MRTFTPTAAASHHDAKNQPLKGQSRQQVQTCIEATRNRQAPKGKDAPSSPRSRSASITPRLSMTTARAAKDFNKKYAPKKALVTCNIAIPRSNLGIPGCPLFFINCPETVPSCRT
jgi:hypothetical protein